VGIDEAAIGSPDGVKQGLVIQHSTRNTIGNVSGDNSPRDLNIAWSSATAPATSDYQAGPDGISPGTGIKGCSRVVAASGQFGPYGTSTSNNRCNSTSLNVFSSWQRSTSASSGGMQMVLNNAAINSSAKMATRAQSTTWGRIVDRKGTFAMGSGGIGTVDARDWSVASGGQTAQARDVLVDYIQIEDGNFPTEAIPTGLTNRAADCLSYGSAENWYVNGRFRAYFAFYPKHDSTDKPEINDGTNRFISDKYYLMSVDENNFIRIDNTTMQIEAKVGGSTSFMVGSMNPVAWSAQDLVEIFVEVGGGANASTNMWYRIGGSGSWTTLTTQGPSTGTCTATGTGYIGKVYSNYGTGSANTGSLVCWLKEFRFYPANGFPDGLDYTSADVSGLILDVDFTQFALGGVSSSSFYPSTGLNFARTSAAWVQTSPSTVSTQISAGWPCIGNAYSDSTRRGLVIENTQKNGVTQNVRNFTTAGGWTAGSGISASFTATGVDGVANSATIFAVASNGFGNYLSAGSSGFDEVFSAFYIPTTQQMMSRPYNIENTGMAKWFEPTGSTYQRFWMLKPDGLAVGYWSYTDGRDYSLVGGQTARVRSGTVDGLLYQRGTFPTSPIMAANTVRQNDRLSYYSGSQLIAPNGQLKYYINCTPMFSSSQTVTQWNPSSAGWGAQPELYLASWGTASGVDVNVTPGNYIRLLSGSRKVAVRFGGISTEYTGTVAPTWQMDDRVEFYFAIGNNLASTASYRTNSGSWISLNLPTIPYSLSGSLGATTPFNFLMNKERADNNATGQPPMFVHRLSIYGSSSLI
jgi:hypothetical protein